jgi:putative pyruvate formate lyase activating enzyme
LNLASNPRHHNNKDSNHRDKTDKKGWCEMGTNIKRGQEFTNNVRERRISDLIKLAYHKYSNCKLCPNECGVNRIAGEIGMCGATLFGDVFYAGLLENEKYDLSPCYKVFFTGCNMSCRFCYLKEMVRHTPANTAKNGLMPRPLFDHPLYNDPNTQKGASIFPSGGEPSVNLLASLYLFGTVPIIPRVWNSNMYYSDFTAGIVAEAADIVIADVHYGNNDCAGWISGAENYLDIAIKNIDHAVKSGLFVIVRHLVMPGHIDCCALPVVEMTSELFPGVNFQVLENYVPPPRRTSYYCLELVDKCGIKDISKVVNTAIEKGLDLRPFFTRDDQNPCINHPITFPTGQVIKNSEEGETKNINAGRVNFHLSHQKPNYADEKIMNAGPARKVADEDLDLSDYSPLSKYFGTRD